MAATPVVGAGYITAVKSLASQINAGTAVPAATTTVNGTVKKAAYQAPAAAADVAALKVQFDALVAKLVAAGIMSAT
ncbi:head fiber protein [Pseudomonas sp.]|uniref:head fiber protein n=1 Tax=Pseudomonas sp. TaxID=306 RepID=UPI003FD8B3A1